MKTRTLIHTSIGIFATGVFAVAAFAGPGPQYWRQMEKARTENAAKEKANPPAANATCADCKTTPIWAPGDRGPAGKGPLHRVIGTSHACAGCAGKIATENGKTKSDMTYRSDCAKLACCK